MMIRLVYVCERETHTHIYHRLPKGVAASSNFWSMKCIQANRTEVVHLAAVFVRHDNLFNVFPYTKCPPSSNKFVYLSESCAIHSVNVPGS